jgi:hypothetical protein
MILCSKKYIGADAVQVDFDAKGAKKAFQTLHRVHVCEHEGGHEAREAFLNCFTWKPFDGQHIQSVCIHIKTKAVEAGILTVEEYDSVFSRWKAQVALYNEPELCMDLSR